MRLRNEVSDLLKPGAANFVEFLMPMKKIATCIKSLLFTALNYRRLPKRVRAV
jgi:hypothetical protein